MERFMRFSLGCALGAAGALLFSGKRREELQRHAGARMRRFLREMAQDSAEGGAQQAAAPVVAVAAAPAQEPAAAVAVGETVATPAVAVAPVISVQEPVRAPSPADLPAWQFATPAAVISTSSHVSTRAGDRSRPIWDCPASLAVHVRG